MEKGINDSGVEVQPDLAVSTGALGVEGVMPEDAEFDAMLSEQLALHPSVAVDDLIGEVRARLDYHGSTAFLRRRQERARTYHEQPLAAGPSSNTDRTFSLIGGGSDNYTREEQVRFIRP